MEQLKKTVTNIVKKRTTIHKQRTAAQGSAVTKKKTGAADEGELSRADTKSSDIKLEKRATKLDKDDSKDEKDTVDI